MNVFASLVKNKKEENLSGLETEEKTSKLNKNQYWLQDQHYALGMEENNSNCWFLL